VGIRRHPSLVEADYGLGNSSSWCGFFWGKTPGKFSLSFFFGFLASYVLTSYLSLFVLFDQSFSWYHTNFFFSAETKKKLSSEISVLKTELDLCRAKMETEHQMHQREEKALRA
jgi:hypothetical protein